MTELVKSDKYIREGDRIKEVLKHFNVSVRDLEKDLTFGRNIINSVLKGEYRKDREEVIKSIADALNISVERLTARDSLNLIEMFNHEYEAGKTVNFESAAYYASQWIKVTITHSEKVEAFNLMGKSLYKLKRYEEARNAYVKSAHSAEKLNDLKMLVRTYNNILLTHLVEGNHEEMINILNMLERLTDKSDKLMQARYTFYRAEASSKLGDYVTAQRLYMEALEVYRETPDESHVAKIMHNIAQMSFNLNNFKDALHYSKEALNIALKKRELPHDVNVMQCLVMKCYVMLNEFECGSEFAHEFSNEFESVENLEVKAMLKLLESILTCNIQPLYAMLEWKLKENTKGYIAKVIFMNQMEIESPSAYKYYLLTEEGKNQYNFLKGDM